MNDSSYKTANMLHKRMFVLLLGLSPASGMTWYLSLIRQTVAERLTDDVFSLAYMWSPVCFSLIAPVSLRSCDTLSAETILGLDEAHCVLLLFIRIS